MKLLTCTVVVDDPGSQWPLAIAGPLGGDHRVRVGRRQATISRQALATHQGRGIDQEDAVERVLESDFEQERNVRNDDLVAASTRFRKPQVTQASDDGMDDAVENIARSRIRKHTLANCRPVE